MQQQLSPSISSPVLRKSYPRNYTLYTVTTLSEDEGNYSVARRYSEFHWLHDALVTSSPGVIVPPLPKKEFFSRFDDQFIQSRIRGLEVFLQRITRHPTLSQLTFVKSFLANQDLKVAQTDFKVFQQQTKIPSPGLSKWIETKVGEISVSKQEIHISSCQIANIEDRLGPIRETISESLERIHRVRNATSDLMSGYTLYERHLEAHCAACNALSTFDDVIDPPTAPTALSQFSQSELNLTKFLLEAIESMRVEVEEPIIRLSQTTDDFSNVLDCQQEVREQYLLKYTLLHKKRAENKEMLELEEEVRRREEIYQTMTNNIVTEYESYKTHKSKDMMAAITSLTTINLRYFQHASQELEALASSIDRIVIESPSAPAPTAPPFSPPPPYPIAAVEPVTYDPTVRTIHGQPVGRVVSGRFVDLSNSTSAELLKVHEEHQNEEIIIGV